MSAVHFTVPALAISEAGFARIDTTGPEPVGTFERLDGSVEPMAVDYTVALTPVPEGPPHMTIATPAPECAHLVTSPFDARPYLHMAPAPRSTLEALRQAIDAALAQPGREQTCEGAWGGQGYVVTLSCAGTEGGSVAGEGRTPQ